MGNGRIRKKENKFTQISTAVLRDSKLSLKAKGLYSLINSYLTIPDWVLYKTFLMGKCIEGEAAFETGWKELKDAGYLLQYKFKDEGGIFYYEYELLDEKKPDPENQGMDNENNPDPENPPLDNPSLENHPLITNTDINSTEENNTQSISQSVYVRDEEILAAKETERPAEITYDEEFIKEQIKYTGLFPLHSKNKSLIDELVLNILDMYYSSAIKVKGESKPQAIVRSILAKLTMQHIEYVVDRYNKVKTPISNKREYLQTMIYTSVLEMDAHWNNKFSSENY